jgi:hypothetical protein
LEAGTTPPLATDLDEGDPTPLRLLDIAG